MTYRGQQTNDEVTLQAQFLSRIGFVRSQISDIESETRQQIAEHGVWIGNPAAPCILEAERSLQNFSQIYGELMMEINSIAANDFMRIPHEYVHPNIEATERLSMGFHNEVMLSLSRQNIMLDAQATLDELDTRQRELLASIPSVRVGFQTDIADLRLHMNFVKSQVFPLLQYALTWFRDDTNVMIANLQTCN